MPSPPLFYRSFSPFLSFLLPFTTSFLTNVPARYIPLEIKLKRVMEQELQVIVKEER